MSSDPYGDMSQAEIHQLGTDRTRMFLYIALTEAIPLLSLVAAFAKLINYGVTIALFIVAAVVIWFIITATIKKMPSTTPPPLRRAIRMLRISFSAAPLLIALVVWFIFNGSTNA